MIGHYNKRKTSNAVIEKSMKIIPHKKFSYCSGDSDIALIRPFSPKSCLVMTTCSLVLLSGHYSSGIKTVLACLKICSIDRFTPSFLFSLITLNHRDALMFLFEYLFMLHPLNSHFELVRCQFSASRIRTWLSIVPKST